jgi:hypothetical protein
MPCTLARRARISPGLSSVAGPLKSARPDPCGRWPSRLVATASENCLTDHQANGAMDLLTSAQRGAFSAIPASVGDQRSTGARWGPGSGITRRSPQGLLLPCNLLRLPAPFAWNVFRFSELMFSSLPYHDGELCRMGSKVTSEVTPNSPPSPRDGRRLLEGTCAYSSGELAAQ